MDDDDCIRGAPPTVSWQGCLRRLRPSVPGPSVLCVLQLGAEALLQRGAEAYGGNLWALKETETCREAFEGRKLAPSISQQQVSETLRHMGLSVEDEVHCPKSG